MKQSIKNQHLPHYSTMLSFLKAINKMNNHLVFNN